MAADILECRLSSLQYDYIEKIRNINEKKSEILGRPVYCLTHTYGCQQNENDTEKINGMLEMMGFVFTEDRSMADFILFNTCAVREHAEQNCGLPCADVCFSSRILLKKWHLINILI